MDRFEHYLKLHEAEGFLREHEMIDGGLYLIHARNSHVGIWDAGASACILWREKRGLHYLFREYHWDRGPPFGTCKPFVKLEGPVPPHAREECLRRKLDELTYEQAMLLTMHLIRS